MSENMGQMIVFLGDRYTCKGDYSVRHGFAMLFQQGSSLAHILSF